MPEKETLERARRDAKAGTAPSTQAGEFVREEFVGALIFGVGLVVVANGCAVGQATSTKAMLSGHVSSVEPAD